MSEGVGSLASTWRPLSSLFSITGLFSYITRLRIRVSSWKISCTFSFCVQFEERFLTRDLRFLDYQSGVVWVRRVSEVRVQLIIIENRFCGDRRCEMMRANLSEVLII